MDNKNKKTFEIRNITKIYKSEHSEVSALRGVNLDLYQGELIVLLGPSGSGKSTLLNIIGGIDFPTEGNVYFNNMELSACTEDQLTEYRRNNVGFVFQFYNLT